LKINGIPCRKTGMREKIFNRKLSAEEVGEN
jgi:hypothetical protein